MTTTTFLPLSIVFPSRRDYPERAYFISRIVAKSGEAIGPFIRVKLKLGNNLLASFRQQHPSLRLWVQKHRVELLLFVLLWGTFAYFYQSTQQNEAARFDQTRAISQEHRLAIHVYSWYSARGN